MTSAEFQSNRTVAKYATVQSRAREVVCKFRTTTSDAEFGKAERGRPMKMADWVTKLDDFPKVGDHDLLIHAGKISAERAKEKAELEHDRYREVIDVRPTQVDRDLDAVIGKLSKTGEKK